MYLVKTFLVSQLCIFASASKQFIRGGGGAQADRELNTRIIGGDEAEEGRYSYAVSLQDDYGHRCGGSLIAPDIVLSAAHCMEIEPLYPGYRAIIGRHDLGTSDGDDVIVKKEIPHEDYNWGTTDNDFMILVLDRPTTETDIDFVQVSSGVVPVGTAVTIMGWGDTHPSDDEWDLAEELMETEVFIISNEECERSNGTVGGTEIDGVLVGGYEENYWDQITDNMVCARDVGEDSCQGDSGGPMVIRQNSVDLQVGIVSWGVSCAHEDFPGIYARISAKYDWIRMHVCNESSSPPSYFECDER